MTIPNIPVSPETQLRRFLYIWEDFNSFLCGYIHRHGVLKRQSVTSLEKVLKDDPAKVIRIISAVNGENALPGREVLFFSLAAALTAAVTISDAYRRELYTTVLYTCKDDAEFFCFIQYLTTFKKKFPSGLVKIIARWYKNKDPMELVQDVCNRKGYHGWTHKDLIKLSHIKPDNTLLEIAICFILKGLPAAEQLANDKKEGKDLIEYIKKNNAFKLAVTAEEVAKYMSEHQVPFDFIPPGYNRNAQCLEALLEYIGLKELLPLVLRLYRLKMFNHDSECLKKVIRILSDASKVKSSGVHPYEVYIAMKFFEKGGKPKDSKLIEHLQKKEKAEKAARNITEFTPTNWARVDPPNRPDILAAFQNCLSLSYSNIAPTSRRFLIAVEISENMSKPCLASKHLSGYEAAALVVMTFLKTERNVIVVVFNGPGVTEVRINKDGTIKDTITTLQNASHGKLQMGAAIEWARNAKKPIDVFINIVHTPTHMNFSDKDNLNINPLEAYVKYKSTMNMSSTKLILHNLDQPLRLCFPENVMDIRGFDVHVPKVMEAYIKNLV